MAEQQYIAIALKADVLDAMFPDQFASFGLRGGEGEHGMWIWITRASTAARPAIPRSGLTTTNGAP